MEDYVTYEQAVKLKELGFDWKCDFIYYFTYHNHNKPIFQRYETVRDYEMEKYWDAPTLAQVQKWFFEEKKIYIEIYCTNYLNNFAYELKFDYAPINNYCTQGFSNPNEALLAGIDNALQIINN